MKVTENALTFAAFIAAFTGCGSGCPDTISWLRLYPLNLDRVMPVRKADKPLFLLQQDFFIPGKAWNAGGMEKGNFLGR